MSRPLDGRRWTFVLATSIAAVVLATLIRLPWVVDAGFPLYDGGMQYAMAQEIAANDLRLPLMTAYNGGDIPFAYPPFGHYSALAFRGLTGLQMFAVFLWLPLLVNLATVAIFPVLAAQLLATRRAVLVASLAFPCFPFSYQWLIMGGGVTRSWGMLFFIVAATGTLLALEDPRPVRLLLAMLGVAGAVLSHPEFAALSILTVPLAALARWRAPDATAVAWRRRRVVTTIVLAGAAALSAPWWVTMLARHGATPFLAAAGSSPGTLSGFLKSLAIFPLTAEPVLSVLGVLGILGALVLATSKRPFVAAWVLLAMAVVPRNSATPITAPLAVAVGFCVDRLLMAGAVRAAERAGSSLLTRLAPLLIAGWVLGYGVLENGLLHQRAERLTPVLTSAERQLMAWVRSNTEPDADFLIIRPGATGRRDPFTEWFPALAEREGVLTPQGREWVGEFRRRRLLEARLDGCVHDGLTCLYRLDREMPDYSHVIVGRRGDPSDPARLRRELRASSEFVLVYDHPAGSVFERRDEASVGPPTSAAASASPD